MVPDGPVMANGDMGVGVGDAKRNNMSYYFGKMDFWTANAFDGRRFAWTHVAPGFVSLSFGALANASAVGWTASQALFRPRVNATLDGGSAGSVHTSAEFDPDANVFVSRVTPAVSTSLTLRLSTQLPSACERGKSCMADLPMRFGVASGAGGGAVLTMTREANHMVNNEATLVECDPQLLPTMGYRNFDVGANGQVTVDTAGDNSPPPPRSFPPAPLCLALRPREGGHATGCGEAMVASQGPCDPSDAGTEWVVGGGGRVTNQQSGLCLAYDPANWSRTVSACPCNGREAAAAGLITDHAWAYDSAAKQLRATAWAGSPETASKLQVPTVGVPRCLLSARPNVNVSLGMAVVVTDDAGRPVPSTGSGGDGGAGSEPFAAHATFALAKGREYRIVVGIETTRRSDVPAGEGALATAVDQVLGADADAVSASNAAWWRGWWASGAEVNLGPDRQVLEAFWYGAQYMLGSMSRPCNGVRTASGRCRDGETVPGLLGPWSMMNPVGWCDRLTLDYNVEANYFGAASSNHLDAMLPYFPLMSSMLPSGRRRAAMAWSSPWHKDGYRDVSGLVSNGHPSFGTWNQDVEHVTCGPGVGTCPNGTGGYRGVQMPCAMGPWDTMAQWKDNSVRFEGALMAVPFVDFFEHTLNQTFLRTQAYPFVREVAEFYSSYLERDPSTGMYCVPLACAQEGCNQRQLGKSVAQRDTTVDLAFAEWSLRKAAGFARALDADAGLRGGWLAKAESLRPYPVVGDPNNGNRTCWSEAVETATNTSTALHANYMYPIVQFAPMHPCGVVNLHSDAATLAVARNTVWGQNQMSKWAPVNGLCLAWPSAAKVVDGDGDPRGEFGSSTLLDLLEGALNRTMQSNFWPSMDGGGVEQVGATQAVNDLLLQSVNRTLHFFPGWEPGPEVSFRRLRTPGALVVSATLRAVGADASRPWRATGGRSVEDVTITSEAGAQCTVAEVDGRVPAVATAGGARVATWREPGNPPRWSFNTTAGATYDLTFE